MSEMSSKILELKKSQEARNAKTESRFIAEWDMNLEFKRLTMEDQKRAELWAKRTYKKDPVVAQGVALFCLSVNHPDFPLSVETVDFLLKEPVSVLSEIIGYVQEVNGLEKKA
jgi:hypothetical protein